MHMSSDYKYSLRLVRARDSDMDRCNCFYEKNELNGG